MKSIHLSSSKTDHQLALFFQLFIVIVLGYLALIRQPLNFDREFLTFAICLTLLALLTVFKLLSRPPGKSLDAVELLLIVVVLWGAPVCLCLVALSKRKAIFALFSR